MIFVYWYLQLKMSCPRQHSKGISHNQCGVLRGYNPETLDVSQPHRINSCQAASTSAHEGLVVLNSSQATEGKSALCALYTVGFGHCSHIVLHAIGLICVLMIDCYLKNGERQERLFSSLP